MPATAPAKQLPRHLGVNGHTRSQFAAGAAPGARKQYGSGAAVAGTGAGGRISKKDIQAAIAARRSETRGSCGAAAQRLQLPLRCHRRRRAERRRRAGRTLGERGAARADVFRQIRSAADVGDAAEDCRAHGGVEARVAARVFRGRSGHDAGVRRRARNRRRSSKALRNEADVHAVFPARPRWKRCAHFPR